MARIWVWHDFVSGVPDSKRGASLFGLTDLLVCLTYYGTVMDGNGRWTMGELHSQGALVGRGSQHGSLGDHQTLNRPLLAPIPM